MDIFKDRDAQLLKFKSCSQLFSKMENSTCTVEGFLTNVTHDESELTQYLYCTKDIVKIDSNFGHKIFKGYKNPNEKIRTSNRGRKKKEEPVDTRKHPGDGSSFNSQISITVPGEVERLKPTSPDKHSPFAETYIISSKTYEKFIKEYKIKVFRNGKFTVPGVLNESLSDVVEPLNKLCSYFSNMFCLDVEMQGLKSVMRNYKFHLLLHKINVRKLQQYCSKHFQSLLNTRFSDIEDFIITPFFEKIAESPGYEGWSQYVNIHPKVYVNIDYHELLDRLKDSSSARNLFVDPDKLINILERENLEEVYNRIRVFIHCLQKSCFVTLSETIIKQIIRYHLRHRLDKIRTMLTKDKDNMLSHIKCDLEKYPGMLIKLKTPNEKKKDKKTTVKIFPSGKINVDGANTREEAEYIYYWLNYLFSQNPDFVLNKEAAVYDGHDSEFSSGSDSD